MTIESYYQRNPLVLTRIGNRLANNLLVPQMHAVEKAYGKANLALVCVQIFCGMDNIHQGTVTLGLANQYEGISGRKKEPERGVTGWLANRQFGRRERIGVRGY